MTQISIYDDVTFPSYPYALSHPERLATIAKMRGVDSPNIEHCRVLELGCGAGGNLIPLADTLPSSEFVGVDLSEQQIAVAQQHVTAIGLKNIQLRAADILQIDRSLGPFDYILCHGVFSWTTEAVRARILPLCRELLSSHGVAYVNFNTYPGWHLQGMLRDMLRFHAQHFSDPADRVREARAMIAFLISSFPAQQSPYGTLRNELAAINRNSDPYLFHAYLNVVNQPFYLHEIVERARDAGLQYLGDADPDAMWPATFVPHTKQRIGELLARAHSPGKNDLTPGSESLSFSTSSDLEQYFDFVRFTTSRHSLFCPRGVAIQSTPAHDAIKVLHLSAPLTVQATPAHAPPASASFVTATGRAITTADPWLLNTFRILSQVWPESRPFQWLESKVGRCVPVANQAAGTRPVPDMTAGSVAWGERWRADLIRCFAAGVIDLSVRANPCTRSISRTPRTAPFARRQAATQNFATTLRHTAVRCSDVDRLVLQQLDGTRDAQEIAGIVQKSGLDSTASPASIGQSLSRLASQAMLVG